MKPILATLTALLTLALVIGSTGCRRATEVAAPADEVAVPSFNAKSGLFLPEATRRALDLKLVEITEQKIETTIPLSLCVYETSAENILATGSLPPDQSPQFPPGRIIAAKLADGTARTGVVRAVRNELQSPTGHLELLVEFPGTAHSLAPGDFISATARISSDGRVIAIPRPALLGNSEGLFAYTVSGEHFVRTAVQTGVSNEEFVEITDGLYAGDQVVAQPVLSLWLTELAAVKGGQACCVTPPKGK
jgi:hypothetical protein